MFCPSVMQDFALSSLRTFLGGKRKARYNALGLFMTMCIES